MPSWLIPFLVFDAIVTIVVVAFVMKKVNAAMSIQINATGMDVRGLMTFMKDEHARIGEYLRVNWSGEPEQLPGVLQNLLAQLEQDLRNRGLTVDHDSLKTMLAASVRQHRVVKPRDLGEAMAKVA